MATVEQNLEQSETTVVTLTARAAVKVSALMAEEPAGEAEVLRIAIQGGGCSGFEYALGFDRGAQSGDHELAWFGFFEFLVFLVILLVAYVYIWRKGALEWR